MHWQEGLTLLCYLFYAIIKVLSSLHFRNHQFYGRTLFEGIQSPGETVYMPHYVHHAVYNMDETVAVGDNPFFSTAIEEAVFQLYKTENDFRFAYSNGSQIFVRKG